MIIRTVLKDIQFLIAQKTCRRRTALLALYSFAILLITINPGNALGARTYKQPPTLSWIPDYPERAPEKTVIPAEAPTLSVSQKGATTSSFYGNASASTHFATDLTGNKFEFMDTFVLPNPLQLNYVRGGADLGDDNYGEIDLSNLGSQDNTFLLKFRSVSRGDLYAKWLKSSWYSDGQNLLGNREEQLFKGYLRGIEQPNILAEISILKETGTTDTGPRDNKLETMWAGFLSSSRSFSIEGAVYTDEFDDNYDSENDVQTMNLALGLDKVIGGKNLVSMDISHNQISKDSGTDNVENTDVTLMGIAYGPFNVDSMKLKGKVRYMNQPSSYETNSEVNNIFETDLSFLFKANTGSLSGGMNSKDIDSTVLSRASIEDFISSSSPSPSQSISTINEDTTHRSDWLRGTILGGKNYKLTAGTSVVKVENPSRSEYVQSGSASLGIDRKEKSDIKLTLMPRQPFNIALSQRDETRRWSDVRRSITGESYMRTRSILCNLPTVGKLSSSIDQSTTNFTYPDDDGGFSAKEDTVSTGLHGGYSINNSWTLFIDHLLMKNEGPSKSQEEFTTFGISYDSQTSKAISFEIAYGRDKFTDYSDEDKNFYAKSLTLSTEAKF